MLKWIWVCDRDKFCFYVSVNEMSDWLEWGKLALRLNSTWRSAGLRCKAVFVLVFFGGGRFSLFVFRFDRIEMVFFVSG